MIQRIQTVFLFLAIIALVLFNIFPYWIAVPTINGESLSLMSYGFNNVVGNEMVTEYGLYTIVAGNSAVAILIILLEIFSYRNRVVQMKLAITNSFLMSINLALMTYFVISLQKDYDGSFGAGIFIYALAMLLNILARRFIQKDEKLVRSVDRLR